jgi:hypothetical protein
VVGRNNQHLSTLGAPYAARCQPLIGHRRLRLLSANLPLAVSKAKIVMTWLSVLRRSPIATLATIEQN